MDNDSELDISVSDASVAVGPEYNLFENRNYVVYRWTFTNWEPNNFHWNTPSHMTIWNDGEWLIFAEHLAHQRPSAGRRYFTHQIKFYDSNNTLIHENDYVLASLTHRQQRWSVSASGVDHTLGRKLSQITRPDGTRWIKS